MSPEALVGFKPSEQAQERLRDFIQRRKTTGLTSDEESELDTYIQLEHHAPG